MRNTLLSFVSAIVFATAAHGQTAFVDDTAAKEHCPSDVVVWINATTKVYHYSGYAYYGRTKKGSYACEREAAPARAATREKRPNS